MDLTPEAIREARFREAWRGYDRTDVDRYLDELATAADGPIVAADEVARAQATVTELRGQADELSATIDALQATRDELRSAITALAAHFSAERSRVQAVLNELSARVDADLVVGSAPEGSTPAIDLEDLATSDAGDAFFEDLRASIAADDGSGLFRRRRHG